MAVSCFSIGVQVRASQMSVELSGIVVAALMRRDSEVQTLTTSWKDASGVTHEVKTQRGEHEEIAAFVQRHRDSVSALQAVYPPA